MTKFASPPKPKPEPTRVLVWYPRIQAWRLPPRRRRLPGPPYVPAGTPSVEFIEAVEAEWVAAKTNYQ